MFAGRRRLLLWPHIVVVSLGVRGVARLGPRQSSVVLERLVRRPMTAIPIDDLAHRVDTTLRWVRLLLEGGCLVRGMTLYYFLRRMGCPVTLEFGVGDIEGHVEGHCWLVMDGRPILENGDPREVFRGIFSMPYAEASS